MALEHAVVQMGLKWVRLWAEVGLKWVGLGAEKRVETSGIGCLSGGRNGCVWTLKWQLKWVRLGAEASFGVLARLHYGHCSYNLSPAEVPVAKPIGAEGSNGAE
nr:hypothetical protein [Tanacetum cinerariifolium]